MHNLKCIYKYSFLFMIMFLKNYLQFRHSEKVKNHRGIHSRRQTYSRLNKIFLMAFFRLQNVFAKHCEQL